MPRATLEAYIKAIDMVRKMSAKPVGSEVPIKITQFCDDHGVRDTLFTVLKELGAIQTEISVRREGTIFSWIYKQAENESRTHLASRVMDYMSQSYKKYYKEYKKKKNPIPPKVTFKDKHTTQGLTIKAGADGVHVKFTQEKDPVKAAQLTESQPEVIELASVAEVAQIETQHREAPKSLHQSLQFSINGSLTKSDLMKKLEVLIDEQVITSFSVEIKY